MAEGDRASCDVAVVGAGISGLTAAFLLEQAGLEVSVLEASDRAGGAIESLAEDGWLFEQGPNTLLDREAVLGRLIAAAGLGEERLAARPTARRRYLWRRGRLVPLPSGPLGFLFGSLFSWRAKLRLLAEPWISPTKEEESIADFVRRRLGRELLELAVGPFVSGVYAGDPERLSVRWAVPRIHRLEAEHGSLVRGALARRKGPGPGGEMISFRTGLETLPRRLAAQLSDLRLGTPCRALHRADDGFRLIAGSEALHASRVVLAVPADVAAELLAPVTNDASRDFARIPYAPVAVASLGFPRERVRHPLDGFGFLAPRSESLRILGCLFPSSMFPARAPEGMVALSAFAGGRLDPEITGLAEDRVWEVVLGDLDRALGIDGMPLFRRLRRWPRAIPQYELGHGRFARLAERIEADLPGLRLAGNWLGGVSVPDCVRKGAAVAEELIAEHATAPGLDG